MSFRVSYIGYLIPLFALCFLASIIYHQDQKECYQEKALVILNNDIISEKTSEKNSELKRQIKDIFNQIDQKIPNVTFSHKDQTTSAKKSRVFIRNPQNRYCVGDQITVQVDAYDYLGKRKTYGGDYLRARIYSPDKGAGSSGRIEDFNNGSYHIYFTLFWEGNISVSVYLMHPSEAVAALWRSRNTGYGNVGYLGKFTSGDKAVETKCGFLLDKKEELCEYADHEDDEYFYCVKPQNFSCHSFTEFKNWKTLITHLSKLENSLIESSNVRVDIPVRFQAIDVVRCSSKYIDPLQTCQNNNNQKLLNIHRAIERLFFGSPKTKVIIKTENTAEMDTEIETETDFHAYVHFAILEVIFQGLNVGFVNGWDMTTAMTFNDQKATTQETQEPATKHACEANMTNQYLMDPYNSSVKEVNPLAAENQPINDNIFQAQRDHVKSLRVLDESYILIHVSQKEEICKTGMGLEYPSGYVMNNIWYPKGCTMRTYNSMEEMNACMKGKFFYMFGDSTMHQWMAYFEQNLKTLRLMNVYEIGWAQKHLGVDLERNIYLIWKRHARPFIYLGFVSHREERTIPREIDLIGGNQHTVIALNIGVHFRLFPVHHYIRRLLNIRRAIERLFLRSPKTKVIIKTENTSDMSNEYEGMSDFHAYVHYAIMEIIFRGLNVGFVNGWDMTTAWNTNQIHPPETFIRNEINMLMTYTCS
ncbi:NXPE family member 4-like [Engystomops pustulosus]|uniref:NXPE family member 4-like n=1 Tax=Engystomops pustulosus TaxID=76066 RepID=UPI003AFAB3B7